MLEKRGVESRKWGVVKGSRENEAEQFASPFPSMDAPSTAVGLDGEEIETGCELKGLSLRRTYG